VSAPTSSGSSRTRWADSGRLDVLVNNAQSFAPYTPLEQVTDEQLDLVLRTGPKGTLWAMQAAFPHLSRRGGRIVNVISLAAERGDPGLGAYNAAKLAILALTRTAAREWGRHGILVNCIAPAAASRRGMDFAARDPERFRRLMETRPVARLGDPLEDIAPIAVFLATADSQYLTGHTFYADGGAHLRRAEDTTVQMGLTDRVGDRDRLEHGHRPRDRPRRVAAEGARVVLKRARPRAPSKRRGGRSLRSSARRSRRFPADVGTAADAPGSSRESAPASGGSTSSSTTRAALAVRGGFMNLADEDWQRAFDLNLMSAVRCSRAVIPTCRSRRPAAIVMISSTSGHQPDTVVCPLQRCEGRAPQPEQDARERVRRGPHPGELRLSRA
jgi:NAD(P)-dependent dehydrogenase (short-subunit alcohol dehydrogenase family)